MVSGSLSSPLRGAFHLSLTVLVHYRSLKLFSLGGWSPLLPTRFLVPRGTQDSSSARSRFLYGTLTLCGGVFHPPSSGRRRSCGWSYNPACSLSPTSSRFGLLPFRSPLLWESRLISLGRATEMFQFTHAPPSGLSIHPAVSRHHSGGVAPLGYSGLSARMQLPLNVSPVSASFIGLQRRGILHALCLACLLLRTEHA